MARTSTTKKTITSATLSGISALKASDLDTIKLFYWDTLEINPDWNERDKESNKYKEQIDYLESSIEEEGVREPLKGFYNPETNKIRIFHGHCRYEALRRLWERGIKVLVKVDVDEKYAKISEAERVFSMLVDNSGLELDQIEKSRVVKRLHNYGWTLIEIGKKMKPKQTAQQIESLLNLSFATEKTKELVRAGKVSPTTVSNSVKAHGADLTETAVSTAVEIAENSGDKKATSDFVGLVRDAIISNEINPAEILANDNPGNKKEAIEDASRVVNNNFKKISEEDILSGNIDSNSLIEVVKKRSRELQKKNYEKSVSAALFLRDALKRIVPTTNPKEENGKILVVFDPLEWDEIMRNLEYDFSDAPKEPEQKEPEQKEVEGQLPLFTTEESA